MAKRYGGYLEANPHSLQDMAYTLASRRERLELASYCLVRGNTLLSPPAAIPSSDVSRIAFVFTGQGMSMRLQKYMNVIANRKKEPNG